MPDGGSPDLGPLLDARHEFMGIEGAHRLAGHLEEVKGLNRIARASRRFIHKVNNDLIKRSDVRNDMEALALSRTAIEEETKLRTRTVALTGDDRAAVDGDLKNILSDHETALLRENIWDYLSNNHDYFFHIIDRLAPAVNGSTPQRLSETPVVRNAIIDQVVDYVANKRGGLPTVREPVEFPAIRGIIKGVLAQASGLSDYRHFNLGDGDPNRLLQGEQNKVQTAYELAKLEKDQAAFDMRDWRREAIKSSAKGIKVFETPYYKSIFERCDVVQDKQNGIGGKVFYGPPGTGKTEIAIYDAEVRNGHKTRAVSMHYWSSFNSLVYEASVKVAGSEVKNLSYQERMLHGISLFSSMSPEEFSNTVNHMLVRLKGQGKVGEDVSPEEFLKPFLGDDTVPGGEKEYAALLQNQVVAGLKQHAAAATFGQVMTEEDFWEEIVKGEVLLAIEKRQDRIILDEGEKAGPYAWAGLSRILSMSGGEQLDVRGRRITIPNNLRFDVTVNSLQIDEFIRSRFNEIFVGYPPAKDEMMITSVWFSDNEGNILLTEEEQYRLAGFFTYMLPQIRTLYDEKVLGQPFDLRVTHELCNILVDPTTKMRTSVSLERAIEMVLFEQRSFLQITEDAAQLVSREQIEARRKEKEIAAYQRLTSLMTDFRQLLEAGAPFAGDEEERLAKEEAHRKEGDLRQLRQATLTKGLQATVFSPLVQASLALPDKVPSPRKIGEGARLTEERHLTRVAIDRLKANKWLEARSKLPNEKEGEEKLPKTSIAIDLGFRIEISGDNGLKLITAPASGHEGREAMEMQLDGNLQLKEIVDATPDGRYVLAKGYNKSTQKDTVYFIECWQKRAGSALDLETDSQGIMMELLPGGNGFIQFNPVKNHLKIGPYSFDHSIKGYELSPDRRSILVRTFYETWFIDFQQMFLRGPDRAVQPTERLHGTDWSFIGNNLLFDKKTQAGFLITSQTTHKGKETTS